jgi:16S rRNA (uracil1498-N3)-methyltransferase
MRRIRLFIDVELQRDVVVELPAAAAEHAVRVLRLGPGDAVTLFNGDGNDYAAELREVGKRQATARVIQTRAVDNESPLKLTLAQAIARGEKMDWIVQKATELGVQRIVPLHTERSEVRLDTRRAEKRLAHWRTVAISACEQCGRARVPHIDPPQTLVQWLGNLTGDGEVRLSLLPDAGRRARELDRSVHGAVLAVGPEGGWGPRDLAALEAARFAGLRLGPRVLRTETAGLAALAALQAVHGDA